MVRRSRIRRNMEEEINEKRKESKPRGGNMVTERRREGKEKYDRERRRETIRKVLLLRPSLHGTLVWI
jgi:hypothetical protein